MNLNQQQQLQHLPQTNRLGDGQNLINQFKNTRTVRHGRDNYDGGNYYQQQTAPQQVFVNNRRYGQQVGPFQLSYEPRFQHHHQQHRTVEYCNELLESCKDAACLKKHSPTEFEVTYHKNFNLSEKSKFNIKKALRLVDKDINRARWALVEAKKQQRNLTSKDLDLLSVKVFELIQQRHAFCMRAFEALYLNWRTNYEFVSTVFREIYRLNGRLPALAKRLELEQAIRQNDFVMVVGQTGSGKSTQIPQYVLDMAEFRNKKVYCTQPRRVATVSLAERVAFEYAGGYEPHGKCGRNVGFQIGGLSNRSHWTRIEYMTEGMLVQHLAEKFSREVDLKAIDEDDSWERITLHDCAAVIVDEVHERNVISDFLLGLLKAKKKDYPNLKVIVSSATVDNKKFSEYLGNCPIVEIPGKTFPVNIEHKAHPFHAQFRTNKDLLVGAVVTKTAEVLNNTREGHILCFVTGQFEAESCREMLLKELQSMPGKYEWTIVYCLFGKQTPEEQREVVSPIEAPFRKVIFATDVAETSLTVDGVRYVIDCGYSKDIVYDSDRNVTALKVFPISKSSADQRAGRAGRTGPGFCYRLFSKEFYDGLDLFTTPEILRRSLSLTVTTLIAIGHNPYKFEWIDAPSTSALKAAEKELRLLGIIKGPIEKAQITDVGRAISCLQIEPSLGRMIYYACKKGYGYAATAIVGLLTSGCPLFSTKPKEPRSPYLSSKGEIVAAYRAFSDWLQLKRLDETEAKFAEKLALQTKIEDEACVTVDPTLFHDEEVTKSVNDRGRDSGLASKTPVIPPTEEHLPNDDGKLEQIDESTMSEAIEYESDGDDEAFEMLVPDEIDELDEFEGVDVITDSMPTSQRIADWSQDHCVSSDACYMAWLEQNSLVNRLQVRGLWTMHSHQTKQPTDEQIQKMALNALAMNVAKLEAPSKWRYRVLATETAAEVFKLCPPRSISPFSPPQWIVFHEASQPQAAPDGTEKPCYLHKVTPVDPDWILGEPQLFPKTLRELVEENISIDESSDDSDDYFYYDDEDSDF